VVRIGDQVIAIPTMTADRFPFGKLISTINTAIFLIVTHGLDLLKKLNVLEKGNNLFLFDLKIKYEYFLS